MTYSIKISSDQTDQAKGLLLFLKSLAQTKDYFFLKIEEEADEEFSKEITDELDFRYEHFMKNKNSFKDWDEIKEKYVKA